MNGRGIPAPSAARCAHVDSGEAEAVCCVQRLSSQTLQEKNKWQDGVLHVGCLGQGAMFREIEIKLLIPQMYVVIPSLVTRCGIGCLDSAERVVFCCCFSQLVLIV